MRILALYDIHGNIDALDAVLADARASSYDAVVVGGDVLPGPYSVAVLERLDALAGDVRWIRGNGEREVAEQIDSSGSPPPDDLPAVTAARTLEQIGPSRARALGALPIALELDGVLFCHATPRDDFEILTRMSPASRWADAYADVSAPLVVAGHTHQQHEQVVGSTRIVNAGSIGLPYEGDGAARWLRVTDGEPEFMRTEYDAAGAGRRMLDDGWPDTLSVSAALIDPVDPDVITRIFEDRAAG